MITILCHKADAVIVEATRKLDELSLHGLLNDVAVVEIGDDTSSGEQPLATCIQAGTRIQMGLYDALASADPPADGRSFMTAVVSGALATQAQLEVAAAVADIAHQTMKLAGGVVVVPICLAVPEARDGSSILPAEGFFTSQTANFVALPTDWRFASGTASFISFVEDEKAAWHAALEIATLTSSWRAMTGNPWQPMIGAPGVSGHIYQFVRSSARLVQIRRRDHVAEDRSLPVADGFEAAPVPEMAARTVEVLHPREFRLESQIGSFSTDSDRITRRAAIVSALGRVFSPLAIGFRGFAKQLRAEFLEAFGGDVQSNDDQPTTSSLPPDEPPAETAVVLKGFDPRLWTKQVRGVLGVADGAPEAARARTAAGNSDFVFVDPKCLVDDVLETRIRSGRRPDEPDAAPEETRAGWFGTVDGEVYPASANPAAANVDPPSSANTGEATPAAEDADPAADPVVDDDDESPKALLTLLDDAFCDEIDRAKARRLTLAKDLEKREQDERDEAARSRPAAAVINIVMAFFMLTYALIAYYVLQIERLDMNDRDYVLMTRIFLGVTALISMVLLYPRMPPNDSDPRVRHSYYVKAAAIPLATFLLAIVFADLLYGWEELREDGHPERGPGLIALTAMIVPLWLGWKVHQLGRECERSASRALALTLAVCYLITGVLVFADRDSFIVDRWEGLNNFLSEYGKELRYAMAAMALIMFLIALVMLIVSDRGNRIRRMRISAEIRELQAELQHHELLPVLRGLRVNWLGTAAALEYILRYNIPAEPASDGDIRDLHSPLLRLFVNPPREVFRRPPSPSWLCNQYEAVVAAYSQRRALLGSEIANRPEASPTVSPIEDDPLVLPSRDPRWELARRLRAGEFDGALAEVTWGTEARSLEDSELEILSEIAPSMPLKLPGSLTGLPSSALSEVEMQSVWWWPDEIEAPNAASPPKPGHVVRSPSEDAYLAVRIDISDQILEDPPSSKPEQPTESVVAEGDVDAGTLMSDSDTDSWLG